MSSGQQLPEDDDEFQEFREADWTEDKEDHEDKDLWLEDWDNEDFDDDFTKQLRAELLKIPPTGVALDTSASGAGSK
ncbi:hypothetical protein BATDEDRAFT_85888 [Batrachochytrium dendrobatidis JAM81]|uniref:26S proteasome complex subunit SEM1 n=1 Tax=Batrachochytrium dendrobatidis (strain JAM81 / FGSC 10211) TaxID=684364 RepID=F4NS39_BATDJ|nr:uncharacterized protein BATDEDRAFT_85888 [Batrachochytrium dendrobatidis JAM81]EGF83392.1 hypothetical protein BATDEDRAFT_85888 [Batrachochytrium dendrobatidis JAM81]KAJ8326851.1 hypothetical protein O5D80_004287 [Batrachochytrium dendrobatidis]|eukprot:XP_006676085.1 hypothetical protein BATDEDRAFT_85888 [Batrachochytrium dendrobatidis JAM81]